MEIALEKEFVA